MTRPLVSVVCLCHNQAKYVKTAIESVWLQTYEKVELIVVDDGSTDGSKQVIRELLAGKSIHFEDIPEPLGNCRAFNQGFALSRGEYIIDLAADDMLLAGRIEAGVQDFLKSPANAGVHFSDAFLCDENNAILRTHYRRDKAGNIIDKVPSGDVYRSVISKYFICPPTMMISRSVMEELGGYDETLAYEDFDFWVRSSRAYTYIFNKAPLVKKRLVPLSHSRSQFQFRNNHQASTFRVCEKIMDLNRQAGEFRALRNRCIYEMRLCLRTLNVELIWKYLKLAIKSHQRRLSSFSSIDK